MVFGTFNGTEQSSSIIAIAASDSLVKLGIEIEVYFNLSRRSWVSEIQNAYNFGDEEAAAEGINLIRSLYPELTMRVVSRSIQKPSPGAALMRQVQNYMQGKNSGEQTPPFGSGEKIVY